MAKNIYKWNEKRLKKITIEVKEEFALPNSTSIIITYKREDRDDKSWEDVLPKARESVYSEVKKLQEFLLERLEVENDRRAN